MTDIYVSFGSFLAGLFGLVGSICCFKYGADYFIDRKQKIIGVMLFFFGMFLFIQGTIGLAYCFDLYSLWDLL